MVDTLFYGFDIGRMVGNVFNFILALIVMDIASGLLASAIEKKLNSSVSFKGMIKKVAELLALVFVTLIDSYFKSNGQIVRLGVSMIIIYEGLSIIENFDKIGINLKFLTKYFDPTKIGKGGKE